LFTGQVKEKQVDLYTEQVGGGKPQAGLEKRMGSGDLFSIKEISYLTPTTQPPNHFQGTTA